MKRKFSFLAALIYVLLTGAIAWQGYELYRQLLPAIPGNDLAMVSVTVDGNVRQPGRYQVVPGTTQFEILRVAGIRPTSDLSMFNLATQVDTGEVLDVGTLEKPVGVNEEPVAIRLEFFFGEINVIGGDGRSVPQHEGLSVSPGDRILTEASSQAELSVGSYSRIDMDNFAELVADKIGVNENERSVIELFQKTGACWYKMVYSKNSELFKINTLPVAISVGGSGADFLVEAQSDRITINLMDGLLLVERIGGGEAINMISGQSATIFTDERPFQVTKLTPETSINERFAQLSREKVNYLSRQMPLNILFCGTPAVFFIVNVQYERNACNVVHLPGELLVEQFANGIGTLDQAFLYGGPVMVATFVERILDTRIPKYITLDKTDIIKIAGAVGGLQVNLDPNAAGYLHLGTGRQKLSDQMLIQYLSRALSGAGDARRRQSDLLRSIFDGLQSRNLIPTVVLADQVVNSSETNFGPTEIMDHYSRFTEKSNWRYHELSVPAQSVKRNERNCLDPDIDKCKNLLSSYE